MKHYGIKKCIHLNLLMRLVLLAVAPVGIRWVSLDSLHKQISWRSYATATWKLLANLPLIWGSAELIKPPGEKYNWGLKVGRRVVHNGKRGDTCLHTFCVRKTTRLQRLSFSPSTALCWGSMDRLAWLVWGIQISHGRDNPVPHSLLSHP